MWLACASLMAVGWQPGHIHRAPTAAPAAAPAARSSVHMQIIKMKTVKIEPPRVGGAPLTEEMLAVTRKFKKEYTTEQLEQLWGALLACYGSADLAQQAVYNNPQILNPSYSFCNTMLASKDVLFSTLGEEEAIEVMLMNPAVLQCGPSLDTIGPDEIKGFAKMRSLGNKIPEEARGFLLSFLLVATLFPIVAENIGLGDSVAATIAKPVVGILFALAIEGSRIVIVGTIFKGKMSGDEKLIAAEEAKARREGKVKAPK